MNPLFGLKFLYLVLEISINVGNMYFFNKIYLSQI